MATSSNIVLSFSEPITRGTGSILLKTDAGATVDTFDPATSNRLTDVYKRQGITPSPAVTPA